MERFLLKINKFRVLKIKLFRVFAKAYKYIKSTNFLDKQKLCQKNITLASY